MYIQGQTGLFSLRPERGRRTNQAEAALRLLFDLSSRAASPQASNCPPPGSSHEQLHRIGASACGVDIYAHRDGGELLAEDIGPMAL